MKARARLAALVSGRGRNLQALIAAQAGGRIKADWVLVASNRADAAALDHARHAGIAVAVVPHQDYPGREAFDDALAQALRVQAPDIIVMAGFMRVLGAAFVNEFAGRMLNIHPSLLPRYPGLHTHRRALEAGDAEHGATVHFVTADLDGGPAVIQGRLSLRRDDEAEAVAQRVLEQVELKIYPQAVAWMAQGDLCLEGGEVRFRGRTLAQPLTLDDLEEGFR